MKRGLLGGRVRLLGAAAMAVVVAATVSACQTNVGSAARIGGAEVSESRLNGYLLTDGPNEKDLAKLRTEAANEGQRLQLPDARPFVLEVLVREQLVSNTLATHGGAPSSAQLSSQRNKIVQSGSLSGIAIAFSAIGVRHKLVTDYVDYFALESLLATRLKLTSQARADAFIAAHGGSVRVNPRYGAWDPKNLVVASSASDGLPNYLTLQK